MKNRFGQLACLAAIFGLVFQVLGTSQTGLIIEDHPACAAHEDSQPTEDSSCPMDPLHNHCGSSCHHFFTAISFSATAFLALQPDLIRTLLPNQEALPEGVSSGLFIPPRLS